MAFLAFNFPYTNMLCMAEKGMIRKFVYTNPFNWLSRFNGPVYFADFKFALLVFGYKKATFSRVGNFEIFEKNFGLKIKGRVQI